MGRRANEKCKESLGEETGGSGCTKEGQRRREKTKRNRKEDGLGGVVQLAHTGNFIEYL
jgi:hypothetical protein